jgi:hypothetical protein
VTLRRAYGEFLRWFRSRGTLPAIENARLIKKFTDDPQFPFLVSFPRTGSHWLRMMMELYFEAPSLVRPFYYGDCQDYIMLHTHDMDLDVHRKNVIYLYRDPAPTVFSQLMYRKENIHDREKIAKWASLYGRHLAKWLLEETVSEKKTVLRYERLLTAAEFCKISDHFGLSFDACKFERCVEQVTRHEVSKRTRHDPEVINLDVSYEKLREKFLLEYSDLVAQVVIGQNGQLQQFFD